MILALFWCNKKYCFGGKFSLLTMRKWKLIFLLPFVAFIRMHDPFFNSMFYHPYGFVYKWCVVLMGPTLYPAHSPQIPRNFRRRGRVHFLTKGVSTSSPRLSFSLCFASAPSFQHLLQSFVEYRSANFPDVFRRPVSSVLFSRTRREKRANVESIGSACFGEDDNGKC